MKNEAYNFAAQTIDRFAEDPERVALQWKKTDGKDLSVTFRTLSLRSNKVANVLRALGIAPGARVLVLLPPMLAWWETVLGIMKTGGVAVLGEDASSHQIVAQQINASQAVALIADVEVAPVVDEIATACPGLHGRIAVGWERDGWVDYDRRVSLASAAFDPVAVQPDDPCLMLFADETYTSLTAYTHGSDRFDLDILDAWRTGDTLVVQEENSSPEL